MDHPLILSLDQGTTSSRAILFSGPTEIRSQSQKEFRQIFPLPGWVEHDPMEIWESQKFVMKDALSKAGVLPEKITAIGITNQRETTILWDRETGKPVHNAIVWQDRRTASICEELKSQGLETYIKNQTGLVADAYFSGTKIKWILDNVPGLRTAAEKGKICFGTIDTWLIWNLTGGKVHATDVSNASRTMLFNLHTLQWDETLLKALNIPPSILPEVKESADDFGMTSPDLFNGIQIPIRGVAGDQQAALFGQTCFEAGMAKNTYGTGCFLLMNTGEQKVFSKHGLLSTIGWKVEGKINYALEGSIFIAGAAIQWLRDGLGIIESAGQSEELAESIPGNEGVYFVPAFAGLGAPWWDMYARGAIYGLTRGSSRAHLVRAALEAICYQTRDVIDAMQKDAGIQLGSLRVDGGAVANNFLMQFQADILGAEVLRPAIHETTALGAALLAGIGAGAWKMNDLKTEWQAERKFYPALDKKKREELYKGWLYAIEKSRTPVSNFEETLP